MKRRVLSLAAIGLLSALALSADGANSAARAACVVGVPNWDVLWMRAGPSVRYRRIGSIGPRACGVRVLWRTCVRGGRWCRVRYRGRSGWVNMRYIDEGGRWANACVVGVPRWDVLWMRAGPSVRYRRVAALPSRYCGVIVTPDCRGNWCFVRSLEGTSGWVNMRYIRMR